MRDAVAEQRLPERRQQTQNTCQADMTFVPLEGHQRVVASYTVRFLGSLADRRADFIMAEAAIAADHAEVLAVVLVRRVEDNEVVPFADFRRQGSRVGNDVWINLWPDIDKGGARVLLVEPDAAVAGGEVEDLHSAPPH